MQGFRKISKLFCSLLFVYSSSLKSFPDSLDMNKIQKQGEFIYVCSSGNNPDRLQRSNFDQPHALQQRSKSLVFAIINHLSMEPLVVRSMPRLLRSRDSVAFFSWFFIFVIATTSRCCTWSTTIRVVIGRIGRALAEGPLLVKNATSFGRLASKSFVI